MRQWEQNDKRRGRDKDLHKVGNTNKRQVKLIGQSKKVRK